MKNMKLLLNFSFFAILSVISTYGQTVTISNLRYTNGALIPNGSAIEIYEGGSKSVTFDLKIDNPQSLSVRGNLYVMSKKSSSASSSIQYLNVDFTNNSLSSWYSKEFTISLNATNFSATDGRLYGQFRVTSSSGGVITGNIIPIKVIPSPTSTIPPEMIFIGGPGGTISTTINEGDIAPVISGTGKGNYTYQWYKTINGVFTLISGATSYYYYPGTPFVTTKYFRENIGTFTNRSNEITITVINNAPPILNNTITIDGMTVNGSIPTGGIGTYQYSWYVIDQDGDTSTLPDTSQNLILTPATFNRYFNSPNNSILRRGVSSGSQGSGSNDLLLPHNSLIENNKITLNGLTVDGSLPTGGLGANSYQYSWYIIDQDGDTSTLTDTSQNLLLAPATFNRYFNSPNNFILRRGVSSGSQSSGSNDLLLPHSSGLSLKTLNNEDTLISAVYPNPTSSTVNFTTGFSTNKEIEIIVYSEKMKNTQSVFKGTATPNQILQWDIPLNYPKGTYYYKIVSDNKEVKTGKILYQ
jgi:hypothetical protein